MKKLMLVSLAVLLIPCLVYAYPQLWKSSNTATAESLQNLCPKANRDVVHGVCVNTCAVGSLIIYDSSWTATTPLFNVATSTAGCNFYDIQTSSGVTYTKTGTANLTILYDCK